MRKLKHWTPTYIYNRLSLELYEKRHPNDPWLTADAIKILQSFLKKTDIGLEWGSGRSTAWLSSRIQFLTSVEHNEEWYIRVKQNLDRLSLNNTEYILANDKNSYLKVVNKFNNNSLDFALVDGRFSRSDCAISVVDKIKSGGTIILDNANRYLPSNSTSPNSISYDAGSASEQWKHFLKLVEDWRVIWTSNGITDTAFFIRH